MAINYRLSDGLNEQPVSAATPLPVTLGASGYETVAASATAQVMGGTGAIGDYLAGVLIIPATTSPGAVSVTDGTGSAVTIFPGGALSVADLKPFFVPFGANSTTGPWKITTGANVSAIGYGLFSA